MKKRGVGGWRPTPSDPDQYTIRYVPGGHYHHHQQHLSQHPPPNPLNTQWPGLHLVPEILRQRRTTFSPAPTGIEGVLTGLTPPAGFTFSE